VKKNEILPVNTSDNSLVAHYPLDGNANDMTRYSNHGEINATVSLDRKNASRKSYQFDSDTSYFQSYNIPIKLNGNYTFSFWIKMNSYNDGMAVMELTKDKEFGKNPQIWQFQDSLFLVPTFQSHNRIYIYSLKKDANVAKMAPTIGYSWNHVLWTVDGTVTKMYVNGIKVDEKSVIWPDYTNVDLTLGNSGNNGGGGANYHNQPSKVSIDEVRIYNKVLTETEIKKLSEW
jgi:hypothetical protein